MVVKTLTVSSPRKRLGLKTYLQFLGVVAVVATIKCVDGVGIQTHEVHGVIKNVNVNYNEKMGRQQCYLTIDTPEQSIQPRQGFSCIDRMRAGQQIRFDMGKTRIFKTLKVSNIRLNQ